MISSMPPIENFMDVPSIQAREYFFKAIYLRIFYLFKFNLQNCLN